MVYHIENRILYRGFHFCINGKDRILKNNGMECSGKWLSGQLVEIISSAPTEEESLPLLCLAAPNRKIRSIPDLVVCPSTIGLFSGLWVNTDWNKLTKIQKTKWERSHPDKEWIGIPVVEGDIFRCPKEKQYYVVLYDLRTGFYLSPIKKVTECVPLCEELLESWQHKGNLWQPPQDIGFALIDVVHKMRAVEQREKEVNIYFI
ncbi:MAG: hypothetical protein IKC03_05615 [Oscillospiraceae bacterium]|nr:hypothetical protein [Oscillospiraceae bacterium]